MHGDGKPSISPSLAPRARYLALLSCLAVLVGVPCVSARGQLQANVVLGRVDRPLPWPQHFSGTRTWITGHIWTSTPGAYITWADLKVGGLTIAHYEPPPGWPFPWPYQYLQDAFASTRFPDGASLEVTMTGADSSGSQVTMTRIATVYNKATIYGRNDFETTVGGEGTVPANANLSIMNHDVSRTETSRGWSALQVLVNIYPCTVFYVNTHGVSAPYFTSDADEANGGVFEYVAPGDVLSRRIAAVGSGTPPNNSGLPPVNLSWIDGCSTSASPYPNANDFAEAFLWPYANAYQSGWTENQAHLGWDIVIPIATAVRVGTAFWQALAAGQTAHQARREALIAYQGAPTPYHLRVWGDFHTRLRGLYTGTEFLAQNFWHY